MSLSNVLLVTRNYQGVCEENFLSTVDEFVEEYCSAERYNGAYVAGLKNVINGAQPYDFAASFYARGDDSYDMRLCQGEEDLLKFLAGDYNDSIEEMEGRNPGSAGFYDFWYWENCADKFSCLAIETVAEHSRHAGHEFHQRLMSVMPDFPKAAPVASNEKRASLADVIKKAEAQKSFRSSKTVSEPTREL